MAQSRAALLDLLMAENADPLDEEDELWSESIASYTDFAPTIGSALGTAIGGALGAAAGGIGAGPGAALGGALGGAAGGIVDGGADMWAGSERSERDKRRLAREQEQLEELAKKRALFSFLG